MQVTTYFSPSHDGWHNLALDEYFLKTAGKGILLYLYVNAGAVILGRNQNAWRECALEKMEEEGIQLVRRISGGGAVFHDLGNLNFSFIAPQAYFNKERQTRVVLEAVRSFGIPAKWAGRNDLVVAERKFSGQAYCSQQDRRLHHGTLLVASDLSQLARYLRPDPKKIQAKGVDSVRSRVANLTAYHPTLTVDKMARALQTAFSKEYGESRERFLLREEEKEVAALEEKHASWEWRFGNTPHFHWELEHRFGWGGVQLQLVLEKGCIKGATLYTDALDESLPFRVAQTLEGCSLKKSEISNRLKMLKGAPYFVELARWLEEKLGERE